MLHDQTAYWPLLLRITFFYRITEEEKINLWSKIWHSLNSKIISIVNVKVITLKNFVQTTTNPLPPFKKTHPCTILLLLLLFIGSSPLKKVGGRESELWNLCVTFFQVWNMTAYILLKTTKVVRSALGSWWLSYSAGDSRSLVLRVYEWILSNYCIYLSLTKFYTYKYLQTKIS